MTETPLTLGIDLGSSRMKALLMERDGRIVGTNAVRTPFRVTEQGVEMQPPELLDAVVGLLLPLRPVLSRVVGVGIASMGEVGSFLRAGVLDETPMLAWYDERGASTVARVHRMFGADVDSLIGRVLRPATTIAKLGWLRMAGYRVDGDWLGVAGIVAWQLTNNYAIEPSLAATTGAFDPVRGEYLPAVLTAAGLEGVRFPPLLDAGTLVGRVTHAGNKWSSIPRGAAVTIAGHDHLVGAAGAGAHGSDVVDSMGTGEPLIRHLPQLPVVAATLVAQGLTVSRWPGGGMAVLAESLRPGLVLPRLAERLGTWSLAELDNLAEQANAARPELGDEVLAALAGGTPDDTLFASAAPGTLWQATLQALAASAVSGIEQLDRAVGAATRVLLIGGGSASPAWLQAKHRAASTPTFVVQTAEAVGRGAAVFAGVAARWWDSPLVAPTPALIALAAREQLAPKLSSPVEL
jgi:xylulokinase